MYNRYLIYIYGICEEEEEDDDMYLHVIVHYNIKYTVMILCTIRKTTK